MPENIEFYSEGCRLAGLLHLPVDIEAGQTRPAIILCHGFAGVKELLLPNFAKKFCDAGFVVLSFDYRGWGGSEGEPNKIAPRDQAQDIRAAITFTTTLTQVDAGKIGLWGTSLGGATSILAATQDIRVAALSVQLAFASGRRMVLGNKSEEDAAKILESITKIRARLVCTGKGMMIPIKKYLPDAQSQAFLEKYGKDFDHLNNKIPFLTTLEMIETNPEDIIGKITVPVLIVGGANDTVNPPEESRMLFERANEPKELMMLEGASHYEVYEGEFFEKVVARQVEFFKKALA